MTNQATPTWAVPGAKVVCVNNSNWFDWDDHVYCDGPAFKEVSTIERTHLDDDGVLLLFLREYSERPEDCYDHRLFRPAVEPKSEAHDVALFEDMARGMSLVERLDRIAETLDA